MSLFKDHNELLGCTGCPFLAVKEEYEKYTYDKDGDYIHFPVPRKNTCLVEGLWATPIWGTLESDSFDVTKPKRSDKCLKLAENIHDQMADAFERQQV